MYHITGAQINEERASQAASEDQKDSKKGKIPVVEIFGPTIQGEGGVIGLQTYFARLGGCDYRCTKCDSLHAVLPHLVKQNSAWLDQSDLANRLLAQMKATKTKWLTLSGGNPAMHDLSVLIGILRQAGIRIAVETQGTLWQDWLMYCDEVTISPKGPGMGETFEGAKFSKMLSMMEMSQREDGRKIYPPPNVSIKFVIMHAMDIEFAKDVILQYGLQHRAQVYLSLGNPYPPGQDSDVDRFVLRNHVLDHYEQTVDDILKEPLLRDCKILPQFHVLLWGNKQGV